MGEHGRVRSGGGQGAGTKANIEHRTSNAQRRWKSRVTSFAKASASQEPVAHAGDRERYVKDYGEPGE
jgi:hypothetical protein